MFFSISRGITIRVSYISHTHLTLLFMLELSCCSPAPILLEIFPVSMLFSYSYCLSLTSLNIFIFLFILIFLFPAILHQTEYTVSHPRCESSDKLGKNAIFLPLPTWYRLIFWYALSTARIFEMYFLMR